MGYKKSILAKSAGVTIPRRAVPPRALICRGAGTVPRGRNPQVRGQCDVTTVVQQRVDGIVLTWLQSDPTPQGGGDGVGGFLAVCSSPRVACTRGSRYVDLSTPARCVVPSLAADVLVVLARTDRPMTGRQIHRLTTGGSWSGVRRVLVDLAVRAWLTSLKRARRICMCSTATTSARRQCLPWLICEGDCLPGFARPSRAGRSHRNRPSLSARRPGATAVVRRTSTSC